MLVFIDESGDPGMKLAKGSSPFFIVTAVVFTSKEEATKCDSHINEIRKQLNVSSHKEFHFTNDNDNICSHFFSEVSQFSFQYSAVVLNKSRATGPGFQYPKSLYKYTSKLVAENICDVIDDAIVVFDKCGDKVFRSQLSRYLKKHVNDRQVRRIKKMKMEKSHTNNLLQLADMTCGAIAQCYTSTKNGRTKYRNIIRGKELRVQVWPPLI